MHTDTENLSRWITLKRTAELTGYTEKALARKIEDNKLQENLVWTRDPDNSVMINLRQFMRWAEKKQAYDEPVKKKRR
ncbi:hypothetical protein GCM10023116_08570 [Kistimonas scapharcae]|uniref:Excisionase n=2 Tax=Kistimonas scapharcae TaxID=1036133 RepID=A0ABP8UXC6_9GAMM